MENIHLYVMFGALEYFVGKFSRKEEHRIKVNQYSFLSCRLNYHSIVYHNIEKHSLSLKGMTNTRAREMLDGGYRMPSPDGAPEEMYQLMLRCWQYEPEDRPHFNEIHSSIDLLYSRYVEHF